MDDLFQSHFMSIDDNCSNIASCTTKQWLHDAKKLAFYWEFGLDWLGWFGFSLACAPVYVDMFKKQIILPTSRKRSITLNVITKHLRIRDKKSILFIRVHHAPHITLKLYATPKKETVCVCVCNSSFFQEAKIGNIPIRILYTQPHTHREKQWSTQIITVSKIITFKWRTVLLK